VIRAVCDRLNALGPRQGLPPLCSGMVVGIDRDPAAKVTIFLFDEAGVPAVAAKVARRPVEAVALRAEHAMLLELRAASLPTIAGELPRPLLMEAIGGRAVLATTVLPGSPMTVRYHEPGHVQDPGLVAGDFRLAGSWLQRFQHETRTGGPVEMAEAFDRWVRPTFVRYRDHVGWSAWEEQLLDRLALLAGGLVDIPVPLVAVHGDYATGNLLVEEDRVSGVVDWERGRRAAPPLSDLFKFAASYGSYLDRAAPPRHGALPGHPGWARARDRWGAFAGWSNAVGFLYAFLGQGWFPDLVRAFLAEHLRRLGLPLSACALFLPVFLAEQAMALDNAVYRDGYRSLLSVLADECNARWLGWLEVAG
jgi:Ser/Thr protein kinase RdoA (MazF antagonist)